jgi:valyl-tRNA synthetase
VKGWSVDDALPQPDYGSISVMWFDARLNEAIAEIDDHFSKYRISDALMTVYKLIWDDFCSWYLEMIKPAYQKPIDPKTFGSTIGFFETLMKILHPFMPFITEEIWHLLAERGETETIMDLPMPQSMSYDKKLLNRFSVEAEVIIAIRKLRAEKNIPNKQSIDLFIRKNNSEKPDRTFDNVVMKLANICEISYVDDKVKGAASFIVGSTEFYIPTGFAVDVSEEIRKLEEEISYTRGFLESVQKKLSNERFVSGAPQDVVEKEKQKQADAESRIKVIEEQLRALGG